MPRRRRSWPRCFRKRGAATCMGATDLGRAWSDDGVSAYGVLQGAGFLFFAFAGYARLATLGAEVIAPERTIVRAIPVALGIVLMVYLVVLLSALAGAGHTALAL